MAGLEVLCCSDFSANDKPLLMRAAGVAHTLGAELTLMHSVDPVRVLPKVSETADFDQIKNYLREALLDLVKAVQGDASNARILIELGHPAKVIPELADRLDARLIVLGARGNSALDPGSMGANVSRIIRQTVRDVLIVKNTAGSGYSRVLVPLDFSFSSSRSLRAAVDLAPEAHFFLLHTCEIAYEGLLHRAGASREEIVENRLREQAEATAALEALARDVNLAKPQFTIIVNHGHPSAKIRSIENDFSCDLVVVGKHGQSMVKEYLLGSIAMTLLAEARSDVLVVS